MLPIITPPRRLFGMHGMSLPICQSKELIADLRDEPVPTTSPTKVTGRLVFSLRSAISCGPFGKSDPPIHVEWSGISARVNAKEAGEKSSVLISPSTL